jgi:anaerobic selenocysteine-containing dehydrogenase
MYHPDRIQGPLARAADGWTSLSWDEALERVAAELARAREEGAASSCGFLTGGATGSRLTVIRRFLEAMGGGPILRHRPFDPTPIAEAHAIATGRRSLFDVEMARASYILSFGAEILESDRSPVRFARALAEMRQGRPGLRGKLVMAGPRLSLTAANADEWIPVRPGHDLDLALAISSVILERGLEDSGFTATRSTDFDRYREFLAANANPSEIAERIGVPLARIERIAVEAASHRPSAALAGFPRASDARAGALALAVSHLNALLGAYSNEGLLRGKGLDAEPAEELSLAAEIRAGKALPPVLFVADTNPVHSMGSSPGL